VQQKQKNQDDQVADADLSLEESSRKRKQGELTSNPSSQDARD
jgi:hypothetical protein